MASSALPWLWVIETLASLKQVDASILKELAKKVPEISGDLGKDAREMVNFRVLESLASQQAGKNRNLSPATVYEKRFNLTDSCEDVVRHILCQRDEIMMFKPQIQNFIRKKRAVLPKCTLQKLKDAILEEHPAFASLKAKSGLSTTSSDSKERADSAEAMCPGSDQKAAQETILISRNVENLNDFSQENGRNRNLTPSKRYFGHLDSEDRALKSHDVSPSSAPGGDCIDLPNQTLEINTFETSTSVKKSRPTPSNIVSCDKSHTKNSSYKPQGAANLNPQKEWSSDRVSFQKERVDIPVEKRHFSSSRCTFSSDPPTMENFTELSLCKKCKKSGDLLLVCSGNPCSVMVHQSCLGSSPNFDNNGKFLCPFCWYSHKMAEYHRVEETASLARKDLAVFIGFENGHSPNNFPKKNIILEQSHQIQDDNANRNNQTHDNNGIQMNSYCKVNTKIGDTSQGEPFIPHVDGNPPLKAEDTLVDDGRVLSSEEGKRDGGKIGLEDQPIILDLETEEVEAYAGQNQGNNRLPCRERESDPLIEKHSPEQGKCTPNAEVAEGSSGRPRKKEKQHSQPAPPKLRRKKVLWTSEEVEVLKKGYKKFHGYHDKWKTILEFGRHVFPQGRTAGDLKDKWRNLGSRHNYVCNVL